MNHILYRCCFSITLFFSICPSIFSEQSTLNENIEAEGQAHEEFQELMTQAKDQNQTIGFCIQQLCQTIIAGKLQLNAQQKQEALEHLKDISNFNTLINDKILVQNTHDALFNGVLLNNIFIEYLLEIVAHNLRKINPNALQMAMTKKLNAPLSEESFMMMAIANQNLMQNLIYATDHIGLTWYNHCYRTLKKYNAPAIIKAAGIIGITTVISGIFLCCLDNPRFFWLTGKMPRLTKEGNWITVDYDKDGTPISTQGAILPIENLEKALQCMTKTEPIHAKHMLDMVTHKNKVSKTAMIPDEKSIKEAAELLTHDVVKIDTIKHAPLYWNNATIIQKIIMSMQNLSGIGMLATSAMITLNYKDLFSWMYKEPIDYAKTKAIKTAHNLDQILDGVAKKNISKNGYDKVSLEDMIGCDDLKDLAQKIANFMKYPERYERAQIEEHRGILLAGPPQCGKTFFAKILRSLIAQEFGNDEQDIHFIDAKKLHDAGFEIDYIFWYASFYAPCIIFIDELDMFGMRRDKDPINTSKLLTCMQGIDIHSQKIIVVATTNKPDQIDPALLTDGRFGKIIHINYPSYTDRLAYLHRELARRCIVLSDEFVDCIAQETEGASYNMLKRIVTEAIILSSIETRAVTQQDFERTLDTEIRHMQATTAMSNEERRIIATYQAGKAVARHLLKTTKEVVKITINPVNHGVKLSEAGLTIANTTQKTSDNDKLQKNNHETNITIGEVFTKSSINHATLVSDSEQEKEAIALLAGHAALQIFFNDPYTQCNKQDRAEAMGIIYNLINNGEQQDQELKNKATAIKQKLEHQAIDLLKDHTELITQIVTILMEQSIIDRYQWKSIISS